MPRPIINASLGANFPSRAAGVLTRTWALALLWLFVLLYATRFVLFKLPAPPSYTDFDQYYVAARALRIGMDPYVDKLDALAHSTGLVLSERISNQTPTFLLCFELLTRLNAHTAYWVWVGISLTSLIVALYILLKLTSLDTRRALLFGALVLLYPAVYEHFYFENVQLVITLLLAAAIYCLERDADRWAGLALAMGAALKGYPALLAFYLVCRGRRRALLWMVVWGSIIGLLTLWGVGLVSFSFLKTLGYTTSKHSLEVPGFLSIDSMISRLFWLDTAPLSPFMDAARVAAIAAVELAVLALTVSATAGAGKDRGWRAFSLWVTAMILLSPIGEPHYLVMLIVPFAAIADAAARGEADPRVIYAAIAGYLVTFSRYPLALMQQHALGSAGFFRFAGQFWAVAIVLVYLAAYWLATSQKFVKHEGRAAWTPAAAQDTH